MLLRKAKRDTDSHLHNLTREISRFGVPGETAVFPGFFRRMKTSQCRSNRPRIALMAQFEDAAFELRPSRRTKCLTVNLSWADVFRHDIALSSSLFYRRFTIYYTYSIWMKKKIRFSTPLSSISQPVAQNILRKLRMFIRFHGLLESFTWNHRILATI